MNALKRVEGVSLDNHPVYFTNDIFASQTVDNAIHSAAGREMLAEECRQFNGCAVGNSVLTGGYRLPAKCE